MTLRAVIFDLYGTLVFDRFSSKRFPPFQALQASLLGLPTGEFSRLWKITFPDRINGRFSTYRENFIWIGRSLGRDLDPSALMEAERNMVDFTRLSLSPRPGSPGVLRRLKALGLGIGLLSDCGPACPRLWEETPLAPLVDAAVFSCREGMRKPDPAFYRTLLERLEVSPAECLYVGDGHGEELDGARQLGMRTALVLSAIDPGEPDRRVLPDWDGTLLLSLAEVPALREE